MLRLPRGFPNPFTYFERQKLDLCGLHAINNLYQNIGDKKEKRPLITKEQMDKICQEIPIVDARNCSDRGYYTMAVLKKALEVHYNCLSYLYQNFNPDETREKREEDPSFDEALNVLNAGLHNFFGPSGAIVLYFKPRVGRHYVAMFRKEDGFYIIDSMLQNGYKKFTNNLEVKEYFDYPYATLVVY